LRFSIEKVRRGVSVYLGGETPPWSGLMLMLMPVILSVFVLAIMLMILVLIFLVVLSAILALIGRIVMLWVLTLLVVILAFVCKSCHCRESNQGKSHYQSGYIFHFTISI
jgi:hypothetical protein